MFDFKQLLVDSGIIVQCGAGINLLGWRSSTAGSSDLLVGSLRINKDKSNQSNHDLICSAFRGENDDKFKPALPSACEALPCKKKIVRDDAKIGRERR